MAETKARSDPRSNRPPDAPAARWTSTSACCAPPGYARRASQREPGGARRDDRRVGRTGCTQIPVVVHVVYRTAAQNISDAQIKSQIDVLNADFRKKNSDIGTVPAAFAALAADARLEFELATTDPSGSPTNGITRTSTAATSFSDDDSGQVRGDRRRTTRGLPTAT